MLPPTSTPVIAYETVTARILPWSFLLLALVVCLPVAAQSKADLDLDREFQAAVAHYNAGQYAQATAQLEKLLPAAPKSFEVHELLGLVYSAQAEDDKANRYLEKAVHLKPDSAPARSNLAANLSRLGKPELALVQFRKAAEIEPQNFDTNHNLGEAYIRTGKVAAARPFLEKAQTINPISYDNGYDLSLAYIMTGQLIEARQQIQNLLKQKDTAELHNLLAQVEEKGGNFIAAANEYETSAHMDPSESNLFDWGSELLVHRTLDPAIEIFQHAVERYPDSPRLMTGLGMAYYSRGNYDDAVKALLKAVDLSPSDSRSYLFLSKAYDSSPSQADEVIARFRRFSELQPRNARALYYYAMSLWKGKRAQDLGLDRRQIESLLKRSIGFDPKLAEAHLQLGNLYSDQNKYAESIPEYVKTIELSPELADSHYRLGQAYVRTGQRERGKEQLEIYQKLRTEHMADLDRQKAEIRQFVYSTKNGPSVKQ